MEMLTLSALRHSVAMGTCVTQQKNRKKEIKLGKTILENCNILNVVTAYCTLLYRLEHSQSLEKAMSAP